MTNTIDELNKFLKEALRLGQKVDLFKEGEAMLICHKKDGKPWELRQQVSENDISENNPQQQPDVGDQLGSIKKNTWFRI